MKSLGSRMVAAGFVVSVVGVALAYAAHDTHMYEFRNGRYRKLGVLKGEGGGSPQAVVCAAGVSCAYVTCGGCHAQPAEPPLSATESKKHLETYYPRAELRLADGQKIPFADATLQRVRDHLELIDGTGRRHALPPGARLLKDRYGKPFLIMHAGTALVLTAVQ